MEHMGVIYLIHELINFWTSLTVLPYHTCWGWLGLLRSSSKAVPPISGHIVCHHKTLYIHIYIYICIENHTYSDYSGYIWSIMLYLNLDYYPIVITCLKLNCRPSGSPTPTCQETSLSVTLGTAAMQGPRPAPPERPHKKLLRRIDLALRGLDFQATQRQVVGWEAICPLVN